MRRPCTQEALERSTGQVLRPAGPFLRPRNKRAWSVLPCRFVFRHLHRFRTFRTGSANGNLPAEDPFGFRRPVDGNRGSAEDEFGSRWEPYGLQLRTLNRRDPEHEPHMKKILLIVLAAVAVAGLVAFYIYRQQSGYTKVLNANIVRQDLATVVTGTGQIKPKTYVNLGATAMGRVTHLYVKEGDKVKKGETVASI